jgi:serine/threonine-protein kinase RsbT
MDGLQSPLKSPNDIVLARQLVRRAAQELGLSLVDQTKVVTAASELARNALIHGQGGVMTLEVVENSGRRGLRLTFSDHGPGIPDVNLALTDGWTSGNGLGLGLSGARRLMNEFTIDSQIGRGTQVTVVRWK